MKSRIYITKTNIWAIYVNINKHLGCKKRNTKNKQLQDE